MADTLAADLDALSLNRSSAMTMAWNFASAQYEASKIMQQNSDRLLQLTNSWLTSLQFSITMEQRESDDAEIDGTSKWLSDRILKDGDGDALKPLEDKETLNLIFSQAKTLKDYIAGPIFQTEDKETVLKITPPEDKLRQLQNAFDVEYLGNAATHLATSLRCHYESTYETSKHYGKSIPIVQSSGTGKSKAVYELSTKELLLSVCFRASDSLNEGWPPRDKAVASFLNAHFGQGFKPEEVAAALYGGLLDATSASADLSAKTTSGFMASWALTNHGGTRDTNFEKAMLYASDKLRSDPAWLVSARVSDSPVETNDTDAAERPAAQDSQEWHRELFKQFVKDPQSELAEKVAEWYKSNRPGETPFFLIAFDECATLNNKGPTSLVALQRIIKAADSFSEHQSVVKFWHLLLDTTSSIYDILLPSGPQAASYRLRADYISPSIWPYMSFDIMVKKRPKSTPAAKSLSIAHLQQYGRPLWATSTEKELPTAAITKLFGIVGISEFNAQDEQHVFAAFSHRVLLELASDSQASTRLAIVLVQRHMRLLMDVVDNNLVVTKCSSEPILSVAAALALTQDPNRYKVAINTLINKLVVEGIVQDVGTMGELCSRILFTMARDFATCFLDPVVPSADCQFLSNRTIKAITLQELLTTMLGPTLGILSPEGQTKQTLDNVLKWAKTVYINFTHFIDVQEPLVDLELSWLEELWFRTSAVQCAFNQPMIDGFFVGYLGNLRLPFDRSKLVVIPWQTKNRRKASAGCTVHSLVSPYLSPGKDKHYKPKDHLVIFMDPLAETHFRDGGGHVNVSHSQAKPIYSKKGKPTWGGFSDVPEEEATRYVVNIRGCSPEIYPIVKQTQFETLFRRLGTRVTTNQEYREQWETETSSYSNN